VSTAPQAVPRAEASFLWPLAARDDVAAALARAVGIASPAAPEWFRLTYEEAAALPVPAFYAVTPPGDGTAAGWLAVVAREGAHVRVVGPDGSLERVLEAEVTRLVRAAAEAPVASAADAVLPRVGLDAARGAAVRAAFVSVALSGERVVEGWRVRARPGSFAQALRAAGLWRRVALTAAIYAVELALLVTAWRLVGARATEGNAGRAGISPWLAVLAAFVFVRAGASWAAGRLALDGARMLRGRLIEGLLGLDSEPLRADGVGRLLGRVMETEAVESLATSGGLLGIAGLFELATGATILALGARGGVELALLAVLLVGAGALCVRLGRTLARWTELRLALTYDLVERMAGHRTLVAQQPPELRHAGEEDALAAYDAASRSMDGASAMLAGFVPRAWLFAGIAVLAPALATSAFGPGAIATAIGGVLFVHGALRKLTQAFPALATATIAWRHVAPLFASPSPASPDSAPASVAEAGAALVAARDLGFRYPGRAQAAIAGCSFEIRRGDRVLLEGASGGGKSTLASLVAGLRAPGEGSLALDGVEQARLGLQRWRERVGVVPQFHENHVFSASMLFNLLMGRAWPPRREDVALAETLCRELDLGGVLARMPSGLEQLVGDGGWQLSHGERSRLFIARSLLQRLDLRVLDESFATLDPETLERVLGCVLRHSETLVVIAHP
jgi:ATP-binding cassette subfamily B protein